MRNSQIITLLLLGTIFTVAVILTLLTFGVISGPSVAQVAPVPAGSQEIAFLVPATSIETWERLVGALVRTKRLWSDRHGDMGPLEYDITEAFPKQSAAVPQFSVWAGDPNKGKLLVRWYKISGEKGTDDWIADLTRRQPPPLAIIGGETTGRAKHISLTLESQRKNWQGLAPLFLITTATADNLIGLYKDRNYRFSFANSSMTRAVLDFVAEQPELLWPAHRFDARVAGAMFGAGNGLTSAALLQLEQKYLNYAMFAVGWEDDDYSVDLRKRFLDEFQKRYYPWSLAAATKSEPTVDIDTLRKWMDNDKIAYSTGDYYHPNYWETFSALHFYEGRDKSTTVRQILVLPTSAERAKRYLKVVISGDPQAVNNLVVVSGDSITFNQIYRDRKVAWNILDLPVPLVFFSHRNPMFRDAGDADGKHQGFLEKGVAARPWATTGLQDLLLHRDILEAVVVAAYRDGTLVANADELDRRLGALRWLPVHDKKGKTVDGQVTYEPEFDLLFEADRNRREGTGEYVVLLQPQRDEQGLLQPQATITTWSRKTLLGVHQDWQQAGILPNVYYADPPSIFEDGKKR